MFELNVERKEEDGAGLTQSREDPLLLTWRRPAPHGHSSVPGGTCPHALCIGLRFLWLLEPSRCWARRDRCRLTERQESGRCSG